MSLDALSTPCLLVERDRLTRNLNRMQDKAAANEVALRPHAKTHKTVSLAREQIERGASGLTVATVDELEAFVEAGVDDVRVAYPVTGRQKHQRLAAGQKNARVSCTVDTVPGAEQASAVHASHDAPLEILLEVDVGHGRCGVPWNDLSTAVPLAQRVVELPGLRLRGLLTHAGQAYAGPHGNETETQALRRVARKERDRMLSLAGHLADNKQLAEAGVAPGSFEISIGSTPSMAAFENVERDGFRITEIRPGNYVVHDAMQVALGAATRPDCALTVLTTVVSTQTGINGSNRAFVDAGKKILTTDTGYGTEGYGIILSDGAEMTPNSTLRVPHLSEEHGWLEGPGTSSLSVGDQLRIVPNHACITIATQSRLHLVDGLEVIDAWPLVTRA